MVWMAPPAASHCAKVGTAQHSTEGEPSMDQPTTIGLDLAKNVFQGHGVDLEGNVVCRRQLRRSASTCGAGDAQQRLPRRSGWKGRRGKSGGACGEASEHHCCCSETAVLLQAIGGNGVGKSWEKRGSTQSRMSISCRGRLMVKPRPCTVCTRSNAWSRVRPCFCNLSRSSLMTSRCVALLVRA